MSRCGMSVAGDSVLKEEELEWRYGASISVRIADCPHTITDISLLVTRQDTPLTAQQTLPSWGHSAGYRTSTYV